MSKCSNRTATANLIPTSRHPAAPARLCPGADPRSRPRRRSGPADRREGAGRPQVVSPGNEFRRMAVPHSAQRVHLGPAPSAPNRVLRRHLHQYPFPSAPTRRAAWSCASSWAPSAAWRPAPARLSCSRRSRAIRTSRSPNPREFRSATVKSRISRGRVALQQMLAEKSPAVRTPALLVPKPLRSPAFSERRIAGRRRPASPLLRRRGPRTI